MYLVGGDLYENQSNKKLHLLIIAMVRRDWDMRKEMGLGSTILRRLMKKPALGLDQRKKCGWAFCPEALFAWFVNMLLLNDEQFIYI